MADPVRAQFARCLRDALDDDGLSQADFAAESGFSTKHVNLMLNEKCGWSMAAMEEAARALGREWVVSLVRVKD